MESWNKIDGLQRLLSRMHPSHDRFSFIKNELSLAERGAAGEWRLEKQLSRLLWNPPLEIFPNVNLQLDGVHIQMDFLIATAGCLYVIESKNISGDLHFDPDTEEFHRIDNDGQRTNLKNPKYQLLGNIRFLRKWLHANGFQIPIKGVVCLTSLSSVIRTKPTAFPLLKLEQIVEYLTSLHEQTSKSYLSDQQFNALCELLISANSPYIFNNLCEKYSISYTDLRKGLICPACSKLTVSRSRGTWHCLACGHMDKEMHLDAIREYFLYTREPLTNQRFREFCKLDSSDAANKLLRSSGLTSNGINRYRSYTCPEAVWIFYKN